MCFVTSAKTLSPAVSASSSCRLAYLKLKAFGSESVSFANESVSIACELQPFPYGPAKAGCPLVCPNLHTPNLDGEPSDLRAPGVLWQWWSRPHNDSFSGSGSSVISS